MSLWLFQTNQTKEIIHQRISKNRDTDQTKQAKISIKKIQRQVVKEKEKTDLVAWDIKTHRRVGVMKMSHPQITITLPTHDIQDQRIVRMKVVVGSNPITSMPTTNQMTSTTMQVLSHMRKHMQSITSEEEEEETEVLTSEEEMTLEEEMTSEEEAEVEMTLEEEAVETTSEEAITTVVEEMINRTK